MMPKRDVIRDTAGELIHGSDPHEQSRTYPQPRGYVTAIPIRRDSLPERAIHQLQGNLQRQVDELRNQHSELSTANEAARRRLEAAQEVLSRRLVNAENVRSALDTLRQQLGEFEGRVGSSQQELTSLRATLGRQAADIQALGNELRKRPQIDAAKLSHTTQTLEHRLHELLNQSLQLKQAIDAETNERLKASQSQADAIARLQELVRHQEATRADQLNNLLRKSDTDRERAVEDAKRLGERVNGISHELTKGFDERELRLREEFGKRCDALQSRVEVQLEAHDTRVTEGRNRADERLRTQSQAVDELKRLFHADKEKYRERFVKINEVLRILDEQLSSSQKKVDRVVNAEIEVRQLHEKGLLEKVNEVDTHLTERIATLEKNMKEAKDEMARANLPAFDIDTLRRDMEAIAADRNKLSVEGLLKLEERISRLSKAFNRDRHELRYKLGDAIEKDINKRLATQLEKLDTLMEEVENAQGKLRQKLERQLPEELSTLTTKLGEVEQQLTTRLDREEEERYLAIKELQEAYGKLATTDGGGRVAGDGTAHSVSLKREVEECKVAIKKLAESLTTVKNVLDRKILEEARKREQDVEVVGARLDNLLVQGSVPPHPPVPPR